MNTKGMNKYYKFLMYVAVVVLINLVGRNLFFHVDLTSGQLYSISPVSKEVVSTLSEPLTVRVFFSQNLPAPHNNTERYLRDLLREYGVYGNRFFNYQFHDVNVKEGEESETARRNREMAENYGIYPVQLPTYKKDEVKFVRAYMGMVLIHGDMIERIPTIGGTEGLEYQITSTIQKMNNKISALLRLPQKIRLKLLLSSSLELVGPYIQLKGLSEIPAKLETAVKKLNDKHYGKLEFTYIDPSKDPAALEQYKKFRLLRLEWPGFKDALGKDIPAGSGVAGIIMEYGNKAMELQVIRAINVPLFGTKYDLAQIEQLERAIEDGVENLIDINEDIGYLADHGTLKLMSLGPMRQPDPDTIGNFNNLVSSSYSIKQVNLKEEDLTETFDTLVIASPGDQFSDYALFQIDQFLMRGNSLAIFLDSFNEVMPQQNQQYFNRNQGPFYIPLNTGLEKLLSHYGITVKKSYVMDENCYKRRMDQRFGGGEQLFYFAPVIQPSFINNDLDFMKNLNQMIMLKISPLEPDEQRVKEFGITANKLFSSSDKGWEMKGRINLTPYMIQPPQNPEEQQSLPLAYVLEGEFPSYFKGKAVPEKPAKEEEKEKGEGEEGNKKEEQPKEEKPAIDLSKIKKDIKVIERGKPGRIFLIGTSEILKDNLIDEEGRSQNAIFLMNVLDYLNGREDIAQMRSKQQQIRLLENPSDTAKSAVKWFNIAGLPILVALAGLLVWFRRRTRKRKIQLQFKK
jgi:ABC-2 type transport system permease protein